MLFQLIIFLSSIFLNEETWFTKSYCIGSVTETCEIKHREFYHTEENFMFKTISVLNFLVTILNILLNFYEFEFRVDQESFRKMSKSLVSFYGVAEASFLIVNIILSSL